MKKLLLSVGLLLAICTPLSSLYGQTRGTVEVIRKLRTTEVIIFEKQHFRDYSRWFIEADLGIPFFAGDVNSLSKDKTHIGGLYGLRVGYQISPTIGVALSGAYGHNKASSPRYAQEYVLGSDAMTYYPPTTVDGIKYADLVSRIRMINIGAHLNINLNNIFIENYGEHLFTVLLQPAVYLQKFNPKVEDKTGVHSALSLKNKLNFGAGTDLAFRFRTGNVVDLQLTSGLIWIVNNKFDGIRTVAKARDSFVWNTGISVIFKLNGKGQKDNLLYAPSASYLRRHGII